MRRLFYIAAEWAIVWLLLAAFGFFFLYFTTGFTLLTGTMFALFALAAIPMAAKFVLFGTSNPRQVLSGQLDPQFYRPIRPIAGAMRAGAALSGTDFPRLDFALGWRDDRDPFDVVQALATDLARLGVAHTLAGALSVEDGATHWHVEPALDGHRIEGWIRGGSAADRAQIVDGLRGFLTDTLALTLEETR